MGSLRQWRAMSFPPYPRRTGARSGCGERVEEWRSTKDIFTTAAHSLNSKDILTIMCNNGKRS